MNAGHRRRTGPCLTEWPTSSEAEARGLAYLYQMRALAIEPELIDAVYDPTERGPVCAWIGGHIASINAQVQGCLQTCQTCFHPWQQRPMAIFAVPLSRAAGVDGLCNLATDPPTILVDVGRLVPDDWIALVAHEVAHVYVGSPGHTREFIEVLSHLARGLGLIVPPASAPTALWQTAPLYHRTPNPHAFWTGQSGWLPAASTPYRL